MQTIETIRDTLLECSYLNWDFICQPMGDGCYIQVAFSDREEREWKGRKWYVSLHATESEVVQTALKAVLAAVEHEAREAFTFKSFAIFGPHHSVHALVGIEQQKRAEVLE